MQFSQIKLQFFWTIADFNGEWVLKNSCICSMATKVIESYLRVSVISTARTLGKGTVVYITL